MDTGLPALLRQEGQERRAAHEADRQALRFSRFPARSHPFQTVSEPPCLPVVQFTYTRFAGPHGRDATRSCTQPTGANPTPRFSTISVALVRGRDESISICGEAQWVCWVKRWKVRGGGGEGAGGAGRDTEGPTQHHAQKRQATVGSPGTHARDFAPMRPRRSLRSTAPNPPPLLPWVRAANELCQPSRETGCASYSNSSLFVRIRVDKGRKNGGKHEVGRSSSSPRVASERGKRRGRPGTNAWSPLQRRSRLGAIAAAVSGCCTFCILRGAVIGVSGSRCAGSATHSPNTPELGKLCD